MLHGDAYKLTGVQRQRNMAQMKKKIKALEKIQLSDEEKANLSDTQFKTLVIRMLTELVEFGRRLDEKMKAMLSDCLLYTSDAADDNRLV